MAAKEFIVAIELGSSKMTGIAGQKNLDGSINVLAVVKEDSSAFIRKGIVYNIDKTAQSLRNIINKLTKQLKTEITQVYVGIGGQSIRGVRNTIVRELAPDTKVTQKMVVELMDANRDTDRPDQEILDTVELEYKLDTQYQQDPVGIQCSRLEGNFLNILMRKTFYKNLNTCFETADISIADMYDAPLALADSVLTEAERRSGCVLVDLGAGTTTVSVYTKNILRHLAVIPLGGANITKDIASTLQTEESNAEQMKLKYGCAYTDSSEIDTDQRYPIDGDRSVESSMFIEIVEGRLEEIIANVRYQIPSEYRDMLLGGVIVTGGGSNMKNIEKAFRIHVGIEKVRVAKFVTQTVNSANEDIKRRNGMMNTVLALLAKGDMNCAGDPYTDGDLFKPKTSGGASTAGKSRTAAETPTGVVRTEAEKKKAEEEARLAEEARQAEEAKKAEAARKAEEEARKAEEEERRRNRPINKFLRGIKKFGENLMKDEEE